MAPTEILAEQHYKEMQKVLEPLGIHTACLRGAWGKRLGGRSWRDLLTALSSRRWDLRSDPRCRYFHSLALAITDEQHRFGVEQRSRLSGKSSYTPHVLVMTATPIPRTLALTVYGDLDVSLMKGLPPGRKPIKTLCYTDEKRADVYAGLIHQVKEGHQAYIVAL